MFVVCGLWFVVCVCGSVVWDLWFVLSNPDPQIVDWLVGWLAG